MLRIENLYTGYKKDIIKGADFNVGRNQFTCIIGANGCGKTTLLKTILCLIKPSKGRILFNGSDVSRMKDKERARKIAYIPQAHIPPFPFKVKDVVMMGRYPHISGINGEKGSDREKVENIMKQLGIEHLAEKAYTELSGGQRQMVIIARALAQEPELLIMDEPTNNLDFGNQYKVLEKVKTLARENDMSVLMVTHSPDHAFYCADQVVVIKDGRIIADGTPQEVVSESNMKDIYNMNVKIAEVDFAVNEAKLHVPDNEMILHPQSAENIKNVSESGNTYSMGAAGTSQPAENCCDLSNEINNINQKNERTKTYVCVAVPETRSYV